MQTQTDDYAIALQRAIEYHCDDKLVPENIARKCPHHAKMLNSHLREHHREKLETYQIQNFNLTQENLRLKREIASHAQQAKIKEDL